MPMRRVDDGNPVALLLGVNDQRVGDRFALVQVVHRAAVGQRDDRDVVDLAERRRRRSPSW